MTWPRPHTPTPHRGPTCPPSAPPVPFRAVSPLSARSPNPTQRRSDRTPLFRCIFPPKPPPKKKPHKIRPIPPQTAPPRPVIYSGLWGRGGGRAAIPYKWVFCREREKAERWGGAERSGAAHGRLWGGPPRRQRCSSRRCGVGVGRGGGLGSVWGRLGSVGVGLGSVWGRGNPWRDSGGRGMEMSHRGWGGFGVVGLGRPMESPIKGLWGFGVPMGRS